MNHKYHIKIFLDRKVNPNNLTIECDDYEFWSASSLDSVYDHWVYKNDDGVTITVRVKSEDIQAVITSVKGEDAQDGQES